MHAYIKVTEAWQEQSWWSFTWPLYLQKTQWPSTKFFSALSFWENDLIWTNWTSFIWSFCWTQSLDISHVIYHDSHSQQPSARKKQLRVIAGHYLRFCLGLIQTSIMGQISTFLKRERNPIFPVSVDMSQAIYALFGFVMEKWWLIL